METKPATATSGRRHSAAFKVIVLGVLLLAGVVLSLSHSSDAAVTDAPYPLGTPSSTDVSGYTLPSANALAGFTGSTLPAHWNTYDGAPGGDPGGMFFPSAVSVANKLLTLTASQNVTDNPSVTGGHWITGGLCHCGVAGQTYGAYFYRSRVTGAGPTTVGLLWPDANVWPPEIDFNETPTGGTGRSTASVHYSASNHIVLSDLFINTTQWHTWGVIWTPTEIIFTVDGQVWGVDMNASTIPNIPMHLSIQQETFCGASPVHACPTSDQSTQVDWVAEYAYDVSSTTTTTTPATPPVAWAADSTDSLMNASASTGVDFPSLSASSAGELYAGYGYSSNHGNGGSTANTTFDATSAGSDLFAFDPSVSGTVAPVGTQTPAGTSSTVAAMMSARGVTGGVIAPVGSLQQASGTGGSDAVQVTPQNEGDAFAVAVRVASSSDSVASVNGGDANWTYLTSYHDGIDGQDIELWLGTITGTDPAPIVVTPSVANVPTQLAVQEFKDAVPAATTTTTVASTTTTSVTPTTATSVTSTTTTSVTPTTTTTVTTVKTAPLGTPKLSSPRINSTQARVKWTDSGTRVTTLTAAIYTRAGCTKVAHTQSVPNALDTIADGEIHFSRANGGAAKAGSFSASRTYYVRITFISGPGGSSAVSKCLTVGKG